MPAVCNTPEVAGKQDWLKQPVPRNEDILITIATLCAHPRSCALWILGSSGVTDEKIQLAMVDLLTDPYSSVSWEARNALKNLVLCPAAIKKIDALEQKSRKFIGHEIRSKDER